MAESFKAEPSVKAEVKDEAAMSPATPFEDDDLYEDAGDLSFYNPNGPEDYNNISLMRVSHDMWKHWSEISDDQEIQIGTMRVWEEPVKTGKEVKNVTRRKMLLNSRFPQHQEIPKEYNLSSNDLFNTVGSQFIYAEEDLPGFKEKSRNTGLPLSVLRARSERVNKPRPARNRRGKEVYYRKAIPKKTKIVGRAVHEMTATPIAAEAHAYLIKRQIDEDKKEGKIGYLSNQFGTKVRDRQTQKVEWDYVPKNQAKPTKAKKAEMKTARIPENELMDKIFKCYEKFQYWSLKSLRAQLKQPEAYLRQTLEKIAILNKSGRFANNWSLKPENVSKNSSVGDIAPEEMGEGATDIEDDDDDEMKMEDAL